MGTGNDEAGFRWTIGGWWGAVGEGQNDVGGVVFNFTLLDNLARGLHSAKVGPLRMSASPYLPKNTLYYMQHIS